jgi:hypothetical protein
MKFNVQEVRWIRTDISMDPAPAQKAPAQEEDDDPMALLKRALG